MNKIYIYTLTDPRDGILKYVGKAKNLRKRFTLHKCDSRGKSKVINWNRKLKSLGLEPIMEVVDECLESDWELMEQYWIAQMKAWGFPLKNMTSGGVVVNTKQLNYLPKGRVYSQESRLKMRNSQLGKKQPLEQRIKKGNSVKKTARSKESGRKVIQIDETSGRLLNVFNTIIEAAEVTGHYRGSIDKVVSNRRVSNRGSIWKWIKTEELSKYNLN